MAKNKKRKKKLDARQTVMLLCIIVAIGSFGYLAFYNYQASHSSEQVDNLNKVKENNNFVFYPRLTHRTEYFDQEKKYKR